MCRHACTVIFSSFVSTTEVQPRLGLDHDTTLQKLWEDAHAWRIEHNVVHSSTPAPIRIRNGTATPSAAVVSGACIPTPFSSASAPSGVEAVCGDDGEEVAPSGASGGGGGGSRAAARRARSPPPDVVRGAGGAGGFAAVDVGRPAEQSTEMFRSLRSVALQLEQVPGHLDESPSIPPSLFQRSSPIESCARPHYSSKFPPVFDATYVGKICTAVACSAQGPIIPTRP
jgi:hypothetical protein